MKNIIVISYSVLIVACALNFSIAIYKININAIAGWVVAIIYVVKSLITELDKF